MGKDRSAGRQGQEPVVRPVTQMTAREFGVGVGRGVFERVILESDWTQFRVRGQMAGGVDGVLWMAKEDAPRKFRNPATALAELRKMGVTRVEVVMGEWDVELATLSMRQRPDVTARRLRRSRMTMAEQMLEASKKDPSLAEWVPEGTKEVGPACREEEYRRLVQAKLDVLARKAREDDKRTRAERAAAEEGKRGEGRRLSDAFIREWENRE